MKRFRIVKQSPWGGTEPVTGDELHRLCTLLDGVAMGMSCSESKFTFRRHPEKEISFATDCPRLCVEIREELSLDQFELEEVSAEHPISNR